MKDTILNQIDNYNKENNIELSENARLTFFGRTS